MRVLETFFGLGVGDMQRAVAFYRTSPQWTWVGGVVYWDRVNDRVLPYAGAIWIPNDHTELRLLFPEALQEI